MTDFREKYFSSNGIKTRYLEAAKSGKGKTILFLHGAYIQASTYSRNIKALSEKYRVIAPDIPCFGQADVPKRMWNYQNYSGYFERLIKTLDLKNVVVVGHSFGGGIALDMAARRIKGVEKAIVFNPAVFLPKRSMIKSYYLLFWKKTFNNIFIYKKPIITFGTVIDGLKLWIKRLFLMPRIIRLVNNCVGTEKPEQKRIRIPVEIIWADKDEIFPRKDAIILHKTISGSVLKFIDGGHEWCILNPEESSRQVDEFIQKTD